MDYTSPQLEPSPARPAPPVLVVEYDRTIRRMLTEVLQTEGYRVFEAADGELALRHMRAHAERAVVLLQLRMPVLDGEGVLEAVAADKDLAERHEIIIMTGSDWSARQERFAELRRLLDVPLVLQPFPLEHMLVAVAEAARKLTAP
jgi:two-component system response regulator AtoC